MEQTSNLKLYHLYHVPYIYYYGRNRVAKEQATFFWTGSGLEINIKGSELWLETVVPEDVLPPWICVYMNKSLLVKLQLLKGKNRVCIFSEMKAETIKNIRIRKESAARFENQDSFFSISALLLDGEFYPLKLPEKKLEVIGDSITSGEGLGGSQEDQVWERWLSSSSPDCHYAERVAEYFQADIRIISQSGWGVYSSYYNQPDHSLPSIYPYVCGVATSDSAKELGALKIYQDNDWNPDVVIINLGTNDAAAFDNPGWVKPETGICYKQQKEVDGSLSLEGRKKLCKAVFDFLMMVRNQNPNAIILWIYGMLKKQVENPIMEGIELYREETRDKKLVYLSAQDTPEAEFGSLGHPGKASHVKVAAQIIKELEKWW